MITEEQLKEWEEIEKNATPGPWGAACHVGINFSNDAYFINMARTAVPLLIQGYREQQKELNLKLAELKHVSMQAAECYEKLREYWNDPIIIKQRKEIDELKRAISLRKDLIPLDELKKLKRIFTEYFSV